MELSQPEQAARARASCGLAHAWLRLLVKPYAAPYLARDSARKRALWMAIFVRVVDVEMAEHLYHTWGRAGALSELSIPMVRAIIARTWGPMDRYLALPVHEASAIPLASLAPEVCGGGETSSRVIIKRVLERYPVLLDWLWCWRARASWRKRRGRLPQDERQLVHDLVEPLLATLRHYVDDDGALVTLVKRARALQQRMKD